MPDEENEIVKKFREMNARAEKTAEKISAFFLNREFSLPELKETSNLTAEKAFEQIRWLSQFGLIETQLKKIGIGQDIQVYKIRKDAAYRISFLEEVNEQYLLKIGENDIVISFLEESKQKEHT